ncbi:hypothetical protein EYC98_18355 [Halieaceae bacterium IMCC14734]|uniref:Lycopene cyclase domain-containing protein n=1 Tax=Candidatus Litorirhabdus singularis TaxID=2518993 RepID=A0ABT3TN79_9GAMM|nr:hypothetical protein [Candidatus Litorirhabdus singularis]MCX2982829.1 hypothetical protein [Candidatus Litorirhabdus singularis]
MSPEHLRVITVVYTSALLPLIIVPWLRSRGRLPDWVPAAYLGSFLLCALGWEIWFTYGLVAGDAVDLRRVDVLNQFLPMHINWLLNSLADAGSITLVGLWLMWLSAGKRAEVFESWQWWPFAVFMVWALGQNVVVEMFLYHDQLAVGKPLSWAPLAPGGPWWNPLLFEFNGRTITFQGQVPWLLAPWLIYGGVIALVRRQNQAGA